MPFEINSPWNKNPFNPFNPLFFLKIRTIRKIRGQEKSQFVSFSKQFVLILQLFAVFSSLIINFAPKLQTE